MANKDFDKLYKQDKDFAEWKKLYLAMIGARINDEWAYLVSNYPNDKVAKEVVKWIKDLLEDYPDLKD